MTSLHDLRAFSLPNRRQVGRAAKVALVYSTIPGFIPRLLRMGLNFGYLAYLMAVVYGAVRLLPAGHPYLDPANAGTYSVRQVVVAASRVMTAGRRRIDQMVVFFAVLAGFFMILAQIAVTIGFLAIGPATAFAGGLPAMLFGGFFVNPTPEQDIAFRLMDQVFGVPGFFGSVDDTGVVPPFQVALHGLFETYSWAMLIVAGIIVLYYLFVVVAESAQTGVPFGERFASIYAPVRLVMAVLLLLPMAYGLNLGQYLTLYVAYTGSSMGSNLWNLFTERLNDRIDDDTTSFIATPNVPEVSELVHFMYLAGSCREAHKKKYGREIKPYLVRMVPGTDGMGTSQDALAISFDDAFKFFKNGNIYIRYGELDAAKYPQNRGNVFPYCGELVLEVDSINQLGSREIYDAYFELLKDIWNDARITYFGQRMANLYLNVNPIDPCSAVDPDGLDADCTKAPSPDHLSLSLEDVQAGFQASVEAARDALMDPANPNSFKLIDPDLVALGWGGAGIWYNKLASVNGSLFSAVMSVPRIYRYPYEMETVMRQKLMTDHFVEPSDVFDTSMSADAQANAATKGDEEIAALLNVVHGYFARDRVMDDEERLSGNIFFDVVNMLFGTEGLFNMYNNRDVHPLAQLVGVGKSLIDKAVRNLIGSTFTSALGGAAGVLMPHAGSMLGLATSFLMSMAMVGLTAGIVLFYVMPFLPFIYFFFSVGKWLKAVFEAMVAVPLWALAHLRIDGVGLVGKPAYDGYFLLFEIFIRPALSIFALLSSVLIFSALAVTLHDIFPLVLGNLTGFDMTTDPGSDFISMMRGPVDEFFFTILYVIIVYMMGISTFKLIDDLPDKILRWMGSSIRSFGDAVPDPAAHLTRNVAITSAVFAGRAAGAFQGLAKAGGEALVGGPKDMASLMTRMGQSAGGLMGLRGGK